MAYYSGQIELIWVRDAATEERPTRITLAGIATSIWIASTNGIRLIDIPLKKMCFKYKAFKDFGQSLPQFCSSVRSSQSALPSQMSPFRDPFK